MTSGAGVSSESSSTNLSPPLLSLATYSSPVVGGDLQCQPRPKKDEPVRVEQANSCTSKREGCDGAAYPSLDVQASGSSSHSMSPTPAPVWDVGPWVLGLLQHKRSHVRALAYGQKILTFEPLTPAEAATDAHHRHHGVPKTSYGCKGDGKACQDPLIHDQRLCRKRLSSLHACVCDHNNLLVDTVECSNTFMFLVFMKNLGHPCGFLWNPDGQQSIVNCEATLGGSMAGLSGAHKNKTILSTPQLS